MDSIKHQLRLHVQSAKEHEKLRLQVMQVEKLENERAIEERKQEIIQAEKESLERNQKDHEERIAAAQRFDWDSWEAETGLTRPEIPR
jgi:hypothetical protein